MTSYHAWTHRPKAEGGTDPIEMETTIPCFRAYQWGQSNVITNNNDDYLRFDRWQTSDATKINGGAWVAGTPDYIIVANCLVRGLYAVTLQVDFSPWGTVGGEIGFSIENAAGTFTSPPMVTMSAAIKAGDASTGYWSWTHIQSFPPIWREQTTDALSPHLPAMRFKMFNKESRTITTGLAMVEIHLLREFDYEALEGSIQSQA